MKYTLCQFFLSRIHQLIYINVNNLRIISIIFDFKGDYIIHIN